MKGIVKFLVRWLVAWVAGASGGVLFIAGVGFRFFEENTGLLIATGVVGLILAFASATLAVRLVNRWLERW